MRSAKKMLLGGLPTVFTVFKTIEKRYSDNHLVARWFSSAEHWALNPVIVANRRNQHKQ